MRILSFFIFLFSYYFVSLYAYRIWRIVGGQNATVNQFPYQVSIRYKYLHMCGGSILSRNFILTAAHCLGTVSTNGKFQLRNATDLTVRAGSLDRFSSGIIMKCSELIVHENYGNFLNDVGLIRLKESLIFSSSVRPLPLASHNVPVNASVVVAGWGRLQQAGDLPRYLQWTNFTITSEAYCKNIMPHYNDGILCLNHTLTTGSCQGDSGGSAIYNNELVGISNYVAPYCAYKKPDAYANVFYFRDWIIKHSDLVN